MPAFKDKRGMRFGKLVVTEYVGNRKWKCVCDCGNTTVVGTGQLTSGHTKSCGCLINERSSEVNAKHGGKNERLYKVWLSMKSRCNNPNNGAYRYYGGRGIKVCQEWDHDYSAFRQWAMENGYNPDAARGECTIDRIDTNGNYCPENCRWVDMEVQRANRRRRTTNGIARAVEQLDMEGNFIRRFDRMKDAFDALEVRRSGHIADVCNGKRKSAFGYKWRYANKDAPEKKGAPRNYRPVEQLDEDGNVMATFPTVSAAEFSMGAKRSSGHVTQACKGIRNLAYGYRWRYAT